MYDADRQPASASRTTYGISRLSHFWGVGLLLGMALLFAVYLWTSRESIAVQPVDVVFIQPPLHGSRTSIEIVPYEQKLEPDAPTCPGAPAGELCLVIGTQNSTPASMTFT